MKEQNDISIGKGVQLWSKREVAHRTGYSERQINYWMAQGRLPYVKLSPRRIRFLQADIEAFVQLHRIG
jgi:predicted DNA-binding transcriptional regulator AlpA